MKLQQLIYAVKVAECGNITEASRRLFVSQPSITASIRELEAEMGVTIFERSNKGVVVTEEGETFLGYARQVLEQVDLPVRGQRRDAEPQLACDLQRLAADGAGRAQKRNYFCHVFLLYSCTVQTIIQIIGAANSTLSNRSSTPPCPGSRRP